MAEEKKVKAPSKLITVYLGWEISAEILESDYPLWERIGYSKERPQVEMTLQEKIAFERRLGIAPK